MGDESPLDKPEFPDYAYFLDIDETAEHPEYIEALGSRPDVFVELRTK